MIRVVYRGATCGDPDAAGIIANELDQRLQVLPILILLMGTHDVWDKPERGKQICMRPIALVPSNLTQMDGACRDAHKHGTRVESGDNTVAKTVLFHNIPTKLNIAAGQEHNIGG